MNYEYDVNYTPPAPTLGLYLSVPERDTTLGPLSGIIDTGADGTLIPTVYLKELRASPIDDAWVRGQWDEWRSVLMYMVDVRVGTTTVPGLHVVGDVRGDEIVLGRNYLNRLRLLLNGPAAITQLLD
ncbi:MAG: hypothetical protein ACLFTI_09885 [Anaerolineales bacterium]